MGELGGISGPIPLEDAVIAAAISLEYFSRFMAGMMTEPVPARSAVDEPIMPPKNMLVSTLTCARPPRSHPTRDRAKSTRRVEMPLAFINVPARTNSGRAMSVKLLTPDTIDCGMPSAHWPDSRKPTETALVSATIIGVPSASSTIRPPITRTADRTMGIS